MVTKEKEAWYIGQRSESLALMYLTRRDDLIISRQQQNASLDFLVTLLKDGNYTGRIFGVQVKATVSTPKLIEHKDIVEIEMDLGLSQFMIEFPFPVCLFFFTLANGQGYYKWILEPVMVEGNYSKLTLNNSNDFYRINNEGISNLVSTANGWYDSRI
ncbi:MAG TPA: hypothetical protein DEG17_23770 [Cyanobacteria bacterium UBA11149]|nr:hypothetical protein [Cyanobacteria bacterium UBA11367]HBE56357.1 hypothetical protein [Cyanobacteria bacterium UBA11366]HBK64223.1 hypothetical protein [Cyanobacteria bacterium UBA11166]HBR72784.1 hypothetical protein [Cyanobacteria bacterium UBA11159]HBS69889.1 hypothetical protein [Cyanobacteria bacterium UBA11153]HBW91800.1 hypothetical protein [Cyanobacteria bacterium UBA11149]HCA93772.1 hypothetical protein [Cyanobacteria bacterium UBA9226]